MSAPAVRYVTTPDGYSLAYTVSGKGRPFVLLPSFINHVQDVWMDGFSVANLLRDASQRYGVIHYDSRGMGMSTRGLPADLSLKDYFTDLETVLEKTKTSRFVLVGFACMAFLAVRFALRHPERVSAMVLIGPPYNWITSSWESMAREDWDGFLADHVSRRYSLEMAQRVYEKFRAWSTQEDYLEYIRIFSQSPVNDLLPQVKTPTLVLWSRGLRDNETGATEFTRLLPNGRLVHLESGLPYGAPGEAIQAIESFLASLDNGADNEGAVLEDGADLSLRELDVLQLIAAGRSNAQIADELTLSQHTVIRHVSNILAKTGAANRAEAASYGHRRGLIG